MMCVHYEELKSSDISLVLQRGKGHVKEQNNEYAVQAPFRTEKFWHKLCSRKAARSDSTTPRPDHGADFLFFASVAWIVSSPLPAAKTIHAPQLNNAYKLKHCDRLANQIQSYSEIEFIECAKRSPRCKQQRRQRRSPSVPRYVAVRCRRSKGSLICPFFVCIVCVFDKHTLASYY